MKSVLISLGVLSAFLVFSSAFVWVHRGIEILSLMLPVLGVTSLIGVFVNGHWIFRLICSAAAAYSLFVVFVSLPPTVTGGDLRIYSKNIRYDNDKTAAIFEDITSASVDVVNLQEVTSKNEDLLRLLSGEFPHQFLCSTAARSDIAIASRIPFETPPKCTGKRALLLTSIKHEDQEIWIGSVHAPWPWPMPHEKAENEMVSVLSALKGPVVLVGDLNTLPWSARMNALTEITGTMLAGPVQSTLRHAKLPVPLPLDYALTPGGGTVSRRPLFGSDHYGILVDVALD